MARRRTIILVPHFGAWDVTLRCLRALATWTPTIYGAEVHVYDDASGTAQAFGAGDPPGVLHHLPHNTCFTAVVNQGLLQFPDADAYVLLNNDVEVTEGWTAALDALTTHPTYAALTPTICTVADPETILFTTTGSCLPGVYQSGTWAEDAAQPEDVVPLRWLPFTCAILRGTAVRQIGVLDPNLRYICSDSDWSFRARVMGWQVGRVRRAKVLHAHTTTTPGDNPFLRECFLADQAWLKDKWMTGRALLALDNTEERIAPYAGEWQDWRLAGRREPLWSRPGAVGAAAP